jgi:ethanolamine utilization microcompartment shell protein EutS
MNKPSFPYLGNQVIISSGRVVAHSKDDMIFLFGKKGIGFSTPATLNMDVQERVIIASPKIELGFEAEFRGDPVLLGRKTVVQLSALLDAVKALSDALSLMTAQTLEVSIPGIVQASTVLSGQATTIKSQLNNSCLSQTTYTR